VINFTFFVPGIVDIQKTEPTKCRMLFLRRLYYIITLSIPKCFEPQRVIIREQVSKNTA